MNVISQKENMLRVNNIIKIGCFAMCCAGGLNQVETMAKKAKAKSKLLTGEENEMSKKAKSKAKSKSKSKAKSTGECKSLMDDENEMHELENKIKMYRCKLLQKEMEYAKLKISIMLDKKSELEKIKS